MSQYGDVTHLVECQVRNLDVAGSSPVISTFCPLGQIFFGVIKMKVCKFGGSSVADSTKIKNVKSILDSDKTRTIVVVSAPGKRDKNDEKITDMLLDCVALRNKGLSFEEKFSLIEKRYLEIAEGLNINQDKIASALYTVKEGIANNKGRDYVVSRGEYLSAVLISEYLGFTFVDAESVIVIGDNNKIEDVTYSNLSSVIKKNGKYVFPGFYGRGKDGEVKTFSRGGSDITGSILARAVNAKVYENWTDVSGVYSSDPRVVKNAHPIPLLSYKETREFSEAGAGVFHEEAIAPLYDKGIPINIKNTKRSEDEGTWIKEKGSKKKGVIGITAKGGFSKIYVRKLMFFKENGMRHKILSLMHIYGINPKYTLYGCDSISWYFETKQAEKIDKDEMMKRMKEEFGLDEAEYLDGFALLALVGEGMEETLEYVDVLDALKKKGIKPTSISLGGSYTTFMIGIKEEKKDEAVRIASKAIFG